MARNKHTFDKHLGVGLVDRKGGYCRVRLKLKPAHLNNGGIAHGGVITALCDIALAGAVGSKLSEGEWCVTVNLNVEFINPAFGGVEIFAYGKVIKRGRTLAFVHGGVETKDKVQIARANGIWALRSKPSKKINTSRMLE